MYLLLFQIDTEIVSWTIQVWFENASGKIDENLLYTYRHQIIWRMEKSIK